MNLNTKLKSTCLTTRLCFSSNRTSKYDVRAMNPLICTYIDKKTGPVLQNKKLLAASMNLSILIKSEYLSNHTSKYDRRSVKTL